MPEIPLQISNFNVLNWIEVTKNGTWIPSISRNWYLKPSLLMYKDQNTQGIDLPLNLWYKPHRSRQ